MRSQVFITPKPMFFPLHTPRDTPNTHDQRGWSPCYRGGVCTELFLPLLPKSSILLTNGSDSWGKAQGGRADPADSGWLAAPYGICVELLDTSIGPLPTPLTQVTRLPTSTGVSGETVERLNQKGSGRREPGLMMRSGTSGNRPPSHTSTQKV